jgi:hypothetical protein
MEHPDDSFHRIFRHSPRRSVRVGANAWLLAIAWTPIVSARQQIKRGTNMMGLINPVPDGDWQRANSSPGGSLPPSPGIGKPAASADRSHACELQRISLSPVGRLTWINFGSGRAVA